MPDQSEPPIVRKLELWAGDGHPHGLLHREAAEIIRLCEEALAELTTQAYAADLAQTGMEDWASLKAAANRAHALLATLKGQNP